MHKNGRNGGDRRVAKSCRELLGNSRNEEVGWAAVSDHKMLEDVHKWGRRGRMEGGI